MSDYKKDIKELSSKVEKLSSEPATDEIVLNKFSNNSTTALTRAEINAMTGRERVRHNLNKFAK